MYIYTFLLIQSYVKYALYVIENEMVGGKEFGASDMFFCICFLSISYCEGVTNLVPTGLICPVSTVGRRCSLS